MNEDKKKISIELDEEIWRVVHDALIIEKNRINDTRPRYKSINESIGGVVYRLRLAITAIYNALPEDGYGQDDTDEAQP